MTRTYRIVFSPEAEAQLASLYDYIAQEASPTIAMRYTDAIIERCEKLEQMPRVGRPRGDLRPGMRTLSFRRRVLIAYAVDEAAVTIIGIFYGGQDFEPLLREEGEP